MEEKGQRANPGGILAPEEIIGRDALVERLWKRLEKQSLYITAERRMGKSSVVRDKMGQGPAPGWRLLYIDVSRASSPLDFLESLLKVATPHLPADTKARVGALGLLRKLAGAEILGVKLPESLAPQWKPLLEAICRDLSDLKPRAVIAFDELPLMLEAIKRRPEFGETVVMEILDTLRAIRQQLDLRMIFTGSLGLHHVLTSLSDRRYQNSPINDMFTVDLLPLDPPSAVELARRLLIGEEIECDDPEAVAGCLAIVTDGMPFYIQHIAVGLNEAATKASMVSVEEFVTARLRDQRDPWDLDYHVKRIETHYLERHRGIARAVLDQLAVHDSRNLESLIDAIDPQATPRDPETAREVLALLGKDHYLELDEAGYRFRSHFMRRVWRTRRSL